jgi:hypothetical protein
MTIQLEKEPDIPKDSNAILVKVCVDDLSLIIGYIGVNKIYLPVYKNKLKIADAELASLEGI